MTNVLLLTTYGFHRDALFRWANCVEDPVLEAMEDFPKRGVLYVQGLLEQVQADKFGIRKDKLPLVPRLLEGSGLTNREIIAESMGHMFAHLFNLSLNTLSQPSTSIAGTDTSAITLSYLCYTLSQRPDVMRKLRDEVDNATEAGVNIMDFSVLQTLPYLTAVLKEALRLYSAVPSLLERVVPDDSKLSGPFQLMGYSLPSGTVVAAQAWSLGRDPIVFPAPDEFRPERWLDGDTSSLDAHYHPFGFGSRICIGRHLAQMMIRIVIAALVSKFDIEAATGTDDASMRIRDIFAIFPVGMKCEV
ncbi:cytochrome P450 [Schizophyllum fasciatum]